jgi:hypothetical protein
MATQETMRRLAAIRRLARQMPLENADKRLAQIAEVASGKGDVDGVFKTNVQNNLAERLEAGMASRSPATGTVEKKEPKKKRKLLGGYDREERGGREREE